MEGGDALLPFVSQFLRFPFNIFDISQGEGGEQGDALMLALFSLGPHSAR